MSASDFLFGSGTKTRVNPYPTVTPEQAAAYSELLSSLSGGGGGATPYPGALGVDLSNLEKTSLSGLEQYAMDLVSGGAGQTLDKSNQALGDILSSGPADIEDYFSKVVQEPLLRNFEEDVLPRIGRRFAPNDFYSSDRVRSEDLARRELGTSLATSRADVAFKARQDAIQNKLAALGLAPGIAGARGALLGQTLEAGKVPREAALTNQALSYDEFIRQQQEKQDKIKALIAALGIPQFENIGVSKGGSTGILSGLASGVGSFLGSYFR